MIARPEQPIMDLDRLDRLTAIVDRTRLALGPSAARQLWPMLGLPDLRTSDHRKVTKEHGPDLLSLLHAPPGSTQPRPVKAWIADFIADRCEHAPLDEMRASVFREAYERWAVENSAPIPKGSGLGKYAKALGVQARKSGGSIYIGLRLKDLAT